jgi:hypothetical protein
VRRKLIFAALEELQRAAGVRRIDPAREQTASLHHLMAGIMDGGSRVLAGPHEREFVGELRVQGKYFGNLDIGIVRPDGLERAANFRGRVRFHVKRIELAGGAQVEDHDAGLVILACGYGAERLERGKFGKRKSQRPESADLEEIATRDAIAGGDRAVSGDVNHTMIALEERVLFEVKITTKGWGVNANGLECWNIVNEVFGPRKQ